MNRWAHFSPAARKSKTAFAGCCVYPGANSGDGVLARKGTHIMGTIPPFFAVGGNPGKVSRLLVIPESMHEFAGEEKYREWIAAQNEYEAENPHVKRERRPC